MKQNHVYNLDMKKQSYSKHLLVLKSNALQELAFSLLEFQTWLFWQPQLVAVTELNKRF